MTREELERLRSDLTHRIVDTERIDALYDHIDRLEREAKAGRELRKNMHSDEGGYFTVLRGHIEAYDTATKETASE